MIKDNYCIGVINIKYFCKIYKDVDIICVYES